MGKNLIVTDSNARMLSSEMATVLTGKYLQVEMLPFSLEEFFDWYKLDLHVLKPEHTTESLVLTDDYLRHGGYPEVVASRQLMRNYLDTLFDSIIWKDMAKRYNVWNVTDLNNLAMYLVPNLCNHVNANELTSEFGFSSVNTTKKYMDYLYEKTMFYYCLRNDKEVDFVLREGARILRLVQVCYDISSPKTEKREVGSIIECAGELKCGNLVIVTYNDKYTIEKDGYRIDSANHRVLSIWMS